MSFLDIIFGVFILGFLAFTRLLDKDEKGFGKETTASLRGVAIIWIMIHHIHTRLEGSSPILTPAYLAVGLFFFISGYGNMLSINRRSEVSLKWMLDKIIKLYIPFFVAYWIHYILLRTFYADLVPPVKKVAVDIITASLPYRDCWFLKIILMCFLIHWVARKLFSDTLKQNVFIFVLIMVYIFIMWKLRVYHKWYTSVACYPLGCIVAQPRIFKKVLDFLREKKVFSFIAFGTLFIASMILVKYKWIITLSCPIWFSLACYYFSLIFKVETKLLSWMGNNSFEFYIFHYIFVQIFDRLADISRYGYAFAVIISTLALVFVYLFVKAKTTVRVKVAK